MKPDYKRDNVGHLGGGKIRKYGPKIGVCLVIFELVVMYNYPD